MTAAVIAAALGGARRSGRRPRAESSVRRDAGAPRLGLRDGIGCAAAAIRDVVAAYRDGRIKDEPAAYNVNWMKQHNFG